MQNLTDEELMQLYGGGDANAFEALYARHRGSLMRYLKRQLNNDALAEELFQEVWVKIINARQTFRANSRFKAWLFQIAHNTLVDCYRRNHKSVLEPLEEKELVSSTSNPERQLSGTSQVKQLLTLIGELPQAQREVFLLKEEAGLSLAEIAAATAASEETTKSRLRYALSKLRSGLEAIYGRV